MTDVVADRAVVLGGGIAGLLTARVLADSYREVLVVDRDPLLGTEGPRRGIPQGRHAHGLLARGGEIMEELFPGLHEGLAEAGVPAGDLAGDIRWYVNGRRLKAARSGLASVSATRPVLEAHLRERVAALPNVRFAERHVIRGLVTTARQERVTGVRVIGSADAVAEQVIEADLVVDATGRGSRMPAWLEELGYAPPAEDRVKIDMAYTTRHFLLRDDPYGTDLSINPIATPRHPRGAFFPKIDGNLSMLSLTGIVGDHPPTDHQGFLEFARSLPVPEIYDAVRTAEPADEAVSFRVAASVRRRFERLRRFPEGLLVIGDGVCAFNPVYGQGMTVAALEAHALQAHLLLGAPRALEFFREIAPLIDVPWDISTGGDLGFPGVEGPRNLMIRFSNAYMAALHAAATNDGHLTAAFFRVAGFADPVSTLMRPGIVARILRHSRLRPESLPPSPRHDLDDGTLPRAA